MNIFLQGIRIRKRHETLESSMGPSHTQERVEVSEPLRNEHGWHSDLYSIWGKGEVCFPKLKYKHTPMLPFCYGTVYI